MRVVETYEIRSALINEMGLDDAEFTIESKEVLSALLRRVAGFHCPCLKRKLVRSVFESLSPIAAEHDSLRQKLYDTLDEMIEFGDLYESRVNNRFDYNDAEALIFILPPTFIQLPSNKILILGVIPDHTSCLPPDLQNDIHYQNTIRLLTIEPLDDEAPYLRELGFQELHLDTWLRSPRIRTFKEHIDRHRKHLNARGNPGMGIGLHVINPDSDVTYYPKRWIEPGDYSGLFVGKRELLYNQQAWCLVELNNGAIEKLIDFPLPTSPYPGRDGAWHLQCAIDAYNGNPQQYRVIDGDKGSQRILQLFSPVPSWTIRFLTTIAEPVELSGCLFAYRIDQMEVEAISTFLKDRLWMSDSEIQ